MCNVCVICDRTVICDLYEHACLYVCECVWFRDGKGGPWEWGRGVGIWRNCGTLLSLSISACVCVCDCMRGFST